MHHLSCLALPLIALVTCSGDVALLTGAPIGDQMEIARNETVADNKPRLVILEQPKAVSFHPRVACLLPLGLLPCCVVHTIYICTYSVANKRVSLKLLKV